MRLLVILALSVSLWASKTEDDLRARLAASEAARLNAVQQLRIQADQAARVQRLVADQLAKISTGNEKRTVTQKQEPCDVDREVPRR